MSRAVPIEWKGFSGLRLDAISVDPILEFLGRDPVRGLKEGGRAEFVKAKYDKGSRVYRVTLDIGAGEEELFVKTFDSAEAARIMLGRMLSRKGLKRPFHYPEKLVKMSVQRSLAVRCWIAAEECGAAGVPVPEHLAYLTRGFGLFREEVLVTRAVKPRTAPDARQFFDLNFVPPLSPEKSALKEALVADLGKLLRAVRGSKIMFPDFKLHNLVLEQKSGQAPRYFVIDLSEAEVGRPGYPESVFLSRFKPSLPDPPVFTREDLELMVRAYLDAGNDPRRVPDIIAMMEK